MAKLDKGVGKFLRGSRRAAAAGFIAYTGLGGLHWAKEAIPPLNLWLNFLCSGVAFIGFVAVVFVGLQTVFSSKDRA